MQHPSIVTLNDITFTYPNAPESLFDGVSASFPRGWSAVLGDNGIGKSTLMGLVRGSLHPDKGVIMPNPAHLVIGYCPQDVAVKPSNLTDFVADWSPEAIAIRNDMGLSDDWAYRYDTLSGGERKRVQIACALALHPDVMILDEPTNHVDAGTWRRIVAAMQQYRGIGIVVSHDADLIDQTCERCIVFTRRHIGSRNVTVAETYQGGYSQAASQIEAKHAAESARMDAARRETARLQAVKTQRFAKVRQVEAIKRAGGRYANPKDHDARNARQLARMTGLDRSVTRAYSQLDGRIAASQQREAGLSVAAKRYDGDIWMDIEPSHRREIIRLEPCVIRFDLSGATAVADTNNGHSRVSADRLCHATLINGRVHVSLPSHRNGNGGSEDTDDRHRNADGMVPDNPEGLAAGLISIGPCDHVAVTGPNGVGKSTLLCAMLTHAATVPRLVIAQNTSDEDASHAMMWLDALSVADRASVLSAYAQLNADPDRLIGGRSPSPGELRKLLLCLALPQRPQLIVMDEPTNHLDLTSKKALARLLRDYPGALIVVSHDEWFLRSAGFPVE